MAHKNIFVNTTFDEVKTNGTPGHMEISECFVDRVVAMVTQCHVIGHTAGIALTPDLSFGGGFRAYIRTLSLLHFLRVTYFLT